MKKAIFFLLVASSSWASCPLSTYPENHKLDQEVSNICDNILNPTINYATMSKASVTSLVVSTTTVSSATVNNLTVSGVLTYAGTLGKVKQILAGTSTTNFTTTNTAFQTTNLVKTIVPTSATAKILVLISGSLSQQTQNNTSFLGISRAGSNITGTNGCNAMFSVTGGNTANAASCVWLDSPATTSSTDYAALLRVGGGTGNFGVNGETQSIVLVEIEP